MKLKNHPCANCTVRKFIGWTILRSYDTDVIIIDNNGWLYVRGLYSATTRKHIGYFLKEYVPDMSFQTAKSLYLNNQACNIYTGEIFSADDVYNAWKSNSV